MRIAHAIFRTTVPCKWLTLVVARQATARLTRSSCSFVWLSHRGILDMFNSVQIYFFRFVSFRSVSQSTVSPIQTSCYCHAELKWIWLESGMTKERQWVQTSRVIKSCRRSKEVQQAMISVWQGKSTPSCYCRGATWQGLPCQVLSPNLSWKLLNVVVLSCFSRFSSARQEHDVWNRP